MVAAVDREFDDAIRAGGVVTILEPRAAPKHTVFVAFSPVALRPLPHIASHVLRAIGRKSHPCILACLRRTLAPALLRVTPLLRELFSPRITAPIHAARGLFPLLLAWQPFAGPFGIGRGAVPTHIDHRMILVPPLDGKPAFSLRYPVLLLPVSTMEVDPFRASFPPVSALVQKPAELLVGHRETVDPEALAYRGHAQIGLLLPSIDELPRGDIDHAVFQARIVRVVPLEQMVHEADDGIGQGALWGLSFNQQRRQLARHEEFHHRLDRKSVVWGK